MATFDTTTYLNNKLAQLNRDQEGGKSWTMADLNTALADAKLTPEQHYAQYGRAEGIQPYADSTTFNTDMYLTNKTAQLNTVAQDGKTNWTKDSTAQAIAAAGMNPAEHYAQYGRSEGITPYSDYAGFDTNAYLTNKTAQLNRDQERGRSDWTNESTAQAISADGMNPLEHYIKYGIQEGISPTAVSQSQQTPGVGTTGTDPNSLVGKGNTAAGAKTYDMITAANLKELGVSVGERVRIGDNVYSIGKDGSINVANSNYLSQGGAFDKDLSASFGFGSSNAGNITGTGGGNGGARNGSGSGNNTDVNTLLTQLAAAMGASTSSGANKSATSGLGTTQSTNWITGDGEKSSDAPAYQQGYATFSAPQAQDWISLFKGQGFGTFQSPQPNTQLNNLLSFDGLYNYAQNVKPNAIDSGNSLSSIQQTINAQVANGTISKGKAQEILDSLQQTTNKVDALQGQVQQLGDGSGGTYLYNNDN